MTDAEIVNADPAELAKFQALASRWWDPTSEFRPLHEINPLRLDWIIARCGGSIAGLDVLDVGCGGGLLAEAMAAAGARVTGIDLAAESLTVAELHALDSGVPVSYRRIAVERLAARQPASFDLVTCREMLEHVPEPESVIDACAKLLRPGSRAVFSTISRNPKAFLFAIVGAEYLLRMLPRGTHDYAKLIKPSELIGGARRSGLEVTALTGLAYNPLTRQYRLTDGDVDVNYLAAFVKP
ncbi:MAG: bifunctional 2-polyprenyl-6-hydroxyphenol methylase/3-demethylubiquinol 3-O-methyltransferase UbiG [Lautropia sp.]